MRLSGFWLRKKLKANGYRSFQVFSSIRQGSKMKDLPILCLKKVLDYMAGKS